MPTDLTPRNSKVEELIHAGDRGTQYPFMRSIQLPQERTNGNIIAYTISACSANLENARFTEANTW